MSRPVVRRMIAVMRDERLYCPACDDVIGVYEPVVVIDQSRARHTSLVREPSLGHGEQTVIHRHCVHVDGGIPPSPERPAGPMR
jgi:hypothetical protein